MKIITVNGEKRYQFEDTDLTARKCFENHMLLSSEEISEIFLTIMQKYTTNKAEGWRHIMALIDSIDPDFENTSRQISYNRITGQFSFIKNDRWANKEPSDAPVS